MKKSITFEETVSRVSAINKKLKEKGIEGEELDAFWARVFRLIPKIKETPIEDIKVCTGCGHLNIEPSGPTAFACCPDGHYIPIDRTPKPAPRNPHPATLNLKH